ERLADLVVVRVGGVGEKVGRRDYQTRGAEAALDGAGLGEGMLNGVQLLVLVEPLDGDHVVALRLRGQHQARADELAVEQHRARAALALLARVLRAWQPEPLAEREEKALALPDVGLVLLAVDAKRDLHVRHRTSARE